MAPQPGVSMLRQADAPEPFFNAIRFSLENEVHAQHERAKATSLDDTNNGGWIHMGVCVCVRTQMTTTYVQGMLLSRVNVFIRRCWTLHYGLRQESLHGRKREDTFVMYGLSGNQGGKKVWILLCVCVCVCVCVCFAHRIGH